MTTRRRLSKQVCRILAIMEALDQEGTLPPREIAETVNRRLASDMAVCLRTVRRDLDALVEMGWITRIERSAAAGLRPTVRYRLRRRKLVKKK